MSLIALAMGVDPAFVVTHHSVRVFLVVLIALPAFAWLQRTGRLGMSRSDRPLSGDRSGAPPEWTRTGVARMILRADTVTRAPMANTSEVPRRRTPAWAFLVGALILGLGLAGAGFLIGRGFERGRSADRYVTVKGLAESFVTADLAVWPLRITATGDDLARVQEQIDARSGDRHRRSLPSRESSRRRSSRNGSR